MAESRFLQIKNKKGPNVLKAIISILKIEINYSLFSLIVFALLIYVGVFYNYYDVIYNAAVNNSEIDYPMGMVFAGGALSMLFLLVGCQFIGYLFNIKEIVNKLKPKTSQEITEEILKN